MMDRNRGKNKDGKNLKKSSQKGFLSIVAVCIVMIVGLISVAASYQFTNDSRVSADLLSSAQAYNMAYSGLESAQNAIITNNNSCTSINGGASYTNATFTGANGVFTVTGAANNVSTTLNANITASSTTLTLTSVTGLSSKGVIKIDNEYINYRGISSKSLTGLTRGVSNTTAAAHSKNASVTQYQCMLNSTGYVPNSTSPVGKRVLQAIFSGSKTFSLGSTNSELYSAGSVSLTGNASITNTSVTTGSSNFAGSNIVSSSNVVLNGNAGTYVSNGSGGLTQISQAGQPFGQDIIQNSSLFNASNLFTSVFNQSKATIKASANQSYTNTTISGATYQSAGNKIIWMDAGLNISGNMTIGSPTSPVILVANSNVNISGNVTIYGLLYVTQGLNLSGNVTIVGFTAVEGAVNSSGNTQITYAYNSNVLQNLLSQSSNINASYTYIKPIASLQEIIP